MAPNEHNDAGSPTQHTTAPSETSPTTAEEDAGGPRRVSRRWLLRAGLGVAGGALAAGVGATIGYYATRYPGGQSQAGWLALTNATVLTGADLEPAAGVTVLIRDGVIIDVGTGVEIPAGAEVSDRSGATVLPGLIDMHTHLGYPDIEPGEEFGTRDIPGYLWDVARFGPDMRRSMLEHGVTAVRSLGDELGWVLDLRDHIADGELEGPRIFCSGPVLTTPGGHPISTHGTPEDSDVIRLPGTPAQARAIVAELTESQRPVDVIKVIHESGSIDRSLAAHDPAVLEAIVTSAHERGVPVTAHCGTLTDLAQAVDAGVDGVEHISLRDPSGTTQDWLDTAARSWPEGTLDRMAEAGITLDPTLMVEFGRRAHQDPDLEPLRDRAYARLLEAHDAGVPIVTGSDAAIPGVAFGLSLVEEIEALADAGLGTRHALRAATSQAAAALGSEEIGVIEPGRAADLLIVDGDPLTDLGALRRVVSVLRDGREVAGSATA